MNVYIVADIEGVAGVPFYASGRADTHLSYEVHAEGRRLMTEEVNAAVRGAKAAGAQTVVIHDHHLVGYNILPELLHPDAELIHGRGERRVDLGELHPDLGNGIDVLLLVGMHPKGGTPRGAQPHSVICVTDGTGTSYEFSESMTSATVAGELGIPTVFISGDRAVCEDTLGYIPTIESVITKSHYAPQFARTRSPLWARQQIEAGVERALRHAANIEPFRLSGPFSVQIADRNPAVRWPKTPARGDSFNGALMEALRTVPWSQPLAEGDDGWRYPDNMKPGSVTNPWNDPDHA